MICTHGNVYSIQVCQLLEEGWWISSDTLVSSTNKTDCNDMAEILLKVVLNNITMDEILEYEKKSTLKCLMTIKLVSYEIKACSVLKC